MRSSKKGARCVYSTPRIIAIVGGRHISSAVGCSRTNGGGLAARVTLSDQEKILTVKERVRRPLARILGHVGHRVIDEAM